MLYLLTNAKEMQMMKHLNETSSKSPSYNPWAGLGPLYRVSLYMFLFFYCIYSNVIKYMHDYLFNVIPLRDSMRDVYVVLLSTEHSDWLIKWALSKYLLNE